MPSTRDSTKITSAEEHLDLTPPITAERFSDAYQKGFHSTVKFLLSRGVSPEAAPDVAQGAWTKGWERRTQLRQADLVLVWTNTIALNIYRLSLRKEPPTETLGEREAASTNLNVEAIDVERLLKQCPPSDRIVLEQHYIHGYKAAEIAQQRGCSETAVRLRIYRARKKIQHHLARPNALPHLPGLAVSSGGAERGPEESHLDETL